MILSSPGDVIFNINGYPIYYYGVVIAFSIIVGLYSCKLICEKLYNKADFEIIYNLSIGAIISGFLGARIYYILVSFGYFSSHLNEVFAFRHGGMSIHGAILGGLIFIIIYLKYKNLPVLKYLDILSFGLISGQIIGRWGNFFNSEAFGLPTFSWLKLYIPIDKRPPEFVSFEYFHPTFLYESLLNIFVLIFLIILAKRTQKSGYVFFAYIILYSLVRIIVENIRIDSILNINGIPIAQIVSIIGIATGIIGICLLRLNDKDS